MLSDLADRVFKELMEAGYDPKLHEPKDEGGPSGSPPRGHEFDIDDFSSTATSSSSLPGADADAAFPGLRAHLDGCPACREEHESLRALVSGEQLL